MKILYYSPHPALGLNDQAGYGTHMREMIHAFQQLGHEVLPVIMGGTEPTAATPAASAGGVKKALKPFVPHGLWETAKDVSLLRFDRYAQQQLEAQIAAFKPDMIYERANYLQLSGVNAAQKWGIKHVLEVNSPYVEERQTLQGKSWLMNKAVKAEQMQVEKSNLVCCVSSALEEYLKKRSKSKYNFIVTPNAINENTYKNYKKDDIENLDKENNDVVFGFVGSFFAWHGIDLMILAFKGLVNQYPNIRLLIVGDGAIRADLEQLAQDCPGVTFTGQVPHGQVFSYIDMMDVAIMANSNWYGSPVKIFEYGAMGKAIIAPDNIPVKDVMVPDIDGILVQPNVESLRSAMEFYIKNPDRRAQMAVHFQQKVLTQHTWQQTAQQILDRVFPVNSQF